MIVFLTLIYVSILFALLKLGLIKLNLWWKISPLFWMLFLLVVLFLPMQWGAPGGAVNVYQSVIEIVPNVAGEVVEVPVKPLVPLKKGDVLFRLDIRPFQNKVKQLEASLKLAKINLGRAQELLAQKVGSKLDVDRLTTEVERLTAELDTAHYDLESTTITAPGDGYVVGLMLRPGQRVGSTPARSFMSFVMLEENRIVMGVNQIYLRHVKPSQKAEVTFKILPGKIIEAEVEALMLITPDGQLAPSGNIALAPTGQTMPQPYAVMLNLDKNELTKAELKTLNLIAQIPGGASGTASIYTESVQATHILRKIMIRMNAWMNYLVPF